MSRACSIRVEEEVRVSEYPIHCVSSPRHSPKNPSAAIQTHVHALYCHSLFLFRFLVILPLRLSSEPRREIGAKDGRIYLAPVDRVDSPFMY